MDTRVGTGIDARAFSKDPSHPLFFACLWWFGERGLEEHSDADVATHAACDVVLIVSGIGDPGTVFGTEQPEWADASGSAFLAEAMRLACADDWATANVSIQVAGQRPRFLPRRAEVEKAMGDVVGTFVGVSVTTTDRLGFTGRGEGLAVIATALVHRI